MSVSIVAIVALVASMAVARHRMEDQGQNGDRRIDSSPAAAKLDLEGIRTAGF